jgi:hypothetical protein
VQKKKKQNLAISTPVQGCSTKDRNNERKGEKKTSRIDKKTLFDRSSNKTKTTKSENDREKKVITARHLSKTKHRILKAGTYKLGSTFPWPRHFPSTLLLSCPCPLVQTPAHLPPTQNGNFKF